MKLVLKLVLIALDMIFSAMNILFIFMILFLIYGTKNYGLQVYNFLILFGLLIIYYKKTMLMFGLYKEVEKDDWNKDKE